MIEKKGSLLQQINTKTQGEFNTLLIRHNLCPECLERLELSSDGELACTKCGLVSEEAKMLRRVIPFGKEATPTNSLAYGKGLGGTLQKKGLFCVLAKSNSDFYTCPKCGYRTNDMPIRAQQTGLITDRNEHPRINTLLRYGRRNAIVWGYDERKSRKGVVFSNYYGNLLRKIGKYFVAENTRANLAEVADAVLAYCLKKLAGDDKCEEAVQVLKLKIDRLKEIWRLLEVDAS